MNGEPVSALALVVIPYGPEDKVRTDMNYAVKSKKDRVI